MDKRSISFTAIDFETANNYMNSACSVAVVRVQDGIIVDCMQQLIKPYKMLFTPLHIGIHGIRPQDVRDMPDFSAFWPTLKPWLEGSTVVAHNASFDISVLKALTSTYGLARAQFEYYCSCQIARAVWPELGSHSLAVVAQHIAFPFKHHDALEDARACAMVVLRAAEQSAAASMPELIGALRLRRKRFGG